ncbi:S24 family peptidase [Paenibacillus larvae]|nr:S24 family peptidase [Paenibacillus larvae]MDT2294903.1 S24 family peptidase [Paenibacillus larvae]
MNSITEDNLETITLPDAMMGKWAGSEDIYIMRVNGESMNKVIPHNSLIVVKDVELSELKNGDIVVYSNGNEYSVKHFYKDEVNNRVIFRPDSTDPSFTDYLVSYEDTTEIKIHGKVVMYVVDSD